jgi:SpoVK/Ycf46/Vps4 family AAA+-type ATPase
MYEKYFLAEDQLNVINNWSHKSNEPLYICGGPGSGKTSLAKAILKETSLTIVDSLFLKNNTNIYEYLVNIIRKKNITMMFSQVKEKRGLIIDDLDVFHKHDKKSYNLVIELLLSYQYFQARVIVISGLKFSNHRSLNKLKCSKINLVYNSHLFHKIVTNICLTENKNLSFNEKHSLIVRSCYNLNTFISLLNTEEVIETQELDDFSSEQLLSEKLFTHEYSLKDIIRLYEGVSVKISLDLLENLSDYFKDLKTICSIYNYYVFSDILNTHCINYQHMKEYPCVMTVYNIYYLFRKNNKIYLSMKNNKYISRSLVNSHSLKLNYGYCYTYRNLIFIYLFMIKNNNYESIIDKVYSINKKELEFYIKSFNYFYNDKIKIENIYKLINK